MELETYEFILIGGGAKSPLWAQIVCNIFNAPVSVPKSCDASFGAALLAGVGIGIWKDEVNAIKQCLKLDRKLTPEPESVAAYKKLFGKYRKIHDVLAEINK